jgi:hypothetical protein
MHWVVPGAFHAPCFAHGEHLFRAGRRLLQFVRASQRPSQDIVGDLLHTPVGTVWPAPVGPGEHVAGGRAQALAPEDGWGVEDEIALRPGVNRGKGTKGTGTLTLVLFSAPNGKPVKNKRAYPVPDPFFSWRVFKTRQKKGVGSSVPFSGSSVRLKITPDPLSFSTFSFLAQPALSSGMKSHR